MFAWQVGQRQTVVANMTDERERERERERECVCVCVWVGACACACVGVGVGMCRLACVCVSINLTIVLSSRNIRVTTPVHLMKCFLKIKLNLLYDIML
jgi:hypothetical protein